MRRGIIVPRIAPKIVWLTTEGSSKGAVLFSSPKRYGVDSMSQDLDTQYFGQPGEEGTPWKREYHSIFGRNPEPWREPLGALRLTLAGDADKVDVVRAQHEIEWLTRVLNGAD